MKNFIVVRKLSKEKKVPYVMLYADLGYRKVVVSMDANVIAEIFGVAVAYIMELPLDKEIIIGTFSRKN